MDFWRTRLLFSPRLLVKSDNSDLVQDDEYSDLVEVYLTSTDEYVGTTVLHYKDYEEYFKWHKGLPETVKAGNFATSQEIEEWNEYKVEGRENITVDTLIYLTVTKD